MARVSSRLDFTMILVYLHVVCLVPHYSLLFEAVSNDIFSDSDVGNYLGQLFGILGAYLKRFG